ncbi:MAG: DNA ligase D, partial [Chloroflexi bacterium]|nr:DNA ligase D [Chloroflexota bacterium]
GTYSPDEGGALSFGDRAQAQERMRADLAAGKLSITLRGRKLHGSWTLVKMQRGDRDWLLIKHRDGAADEERDITEEERSVISGLSIDDLKSGRLPDRSARGAVVLSPTDAAGAHAQALPKSLSPMLASIGDKPFSDPAWLFEPKLDGMRALAFVRDGTATLLARSGLDATRQYPTLAAEIARQPAHEALFDGEIVALDDEGRPSFELLQQRLNLTREPDIRRADAQLPVRYYAFDLLHLDGYGLRATPLEQRKALLERALLPSEGVRYLNHFPEEGEAAYQAARDLGLEGIVAKRRDSRYEPGRRTRSWLKIKATLSDEFVVGGYSVGQGARAATCGALLLGRYDGAGRLVYAGSAGSGFDDRTLAALRHRLDALRGDGCPFAETPPLKGETVWVRPQLVVEVKFAQWTQEGYLRAPVFLRLRPDTPAAQVRIEAPDGGSSAVPPEDGAGDVLEQLGGGKDKLTLSVQGHALALNNLDKELWPKQGRRRALTKRDLLVYFAQAAPYLLPHLRDRPLTLVRFPNGIGGEHFYQKHWGAPLPEFVETVALYSSHNEGDQEYLVCNNLATLLWLGQIANLELHTWYSRISPEPDGAHLSRTFTGSREQIEASLLNYPDFIVFDLDPYIYSGKEAAGDEPELNRKAFARTCEVALWLKDVLDSLSLSSFVKTSGKTGLHIYVPVLRQLDYDAARAASETIGRFVLQAHPRDVTMEWSVDKRPGKVFLDYNQNARGKTLASIYSPRALAGA